MSIARVLVRAARPALLRLTLGAATARLPSAGRQVAQPYVGSLQQARGLQAWVHSFWEEPSAEDEGAAADEPETATADLEPAIKDPPGADAEEGEPAVAGDVAQFAKSAIVELDDDVFAAEPRLDVVHRVVVWQRREWWQGTGSAKGRAEVRGGGRKPWRQKGTGRARVSSIRNPLWRGGGVTHGPRPRDHSIKIPNKVHRMALRVALSVKFAQGDLIVVDDFDIPTHKTRFMRQAMNVAGLNVPTLFVDGDTPPDNFLKSTMNLPDAVAVGSEEISVYAMLHNHKLVLTRSAVARLQERLTTAKVPITAVNTPQAAAM